MAGKECFEMLGMGNSYPERKGTPQPHPSFYLAPKTPEFATTGESPFFTMDPNPKTALPQGGGVYLSERKR
jgi:hypothetical protein